MSRWQRHPEQRPHAAGIERGQSGWSMIWALDQPGCAALVPPGGDATERLRVALYEFALWSHHRRPTGVDWSGLPVEIAQNVQTGADVRLGETSAAFEFDAEPPAAREFPLWANPHDLALDELFELGKGLGEPFLGLNSSERRSVHDVLRHCAEHERFLASCLSARPQKPQSSHTAEETLRELQDAHRHLQQVVCDSPASNKAQLEGQTEVWSTRKVMRRSIWHLRYHTWEARRIVGTLWLEQ